MDDRRIRYPDFGRTARQVMTQEAVLSFIVAAQPAWGTVFDEGQEGSNGIVAKKNSIKSREHAAPEPLLLLPAPKHSDADKAVDDGSVETPRKRPETDVLSFKPRSADERAEDFLIDWVRRFSRS